MEKIVLAKGREWSVQNRHPWVFGGAVAEGSAGLGATVEVFSHSGERLGAGWYSPKSEIRVRMVAFGSEEISIPALVSAAVGRRADFFVNSYTNAVRLVNAESDGLPGVVVDCYAGYAICQFTSAGAEANKREIADALMNYVPMCRAVCERSDVKERAKEGLECGGFSVLAGEEPPEFVEIFEGGCKFLVDVRNGHKTGFYLDQRDARAIVGAVCNGAEVLNAFSYTGGFGLFARAAGAAKVTQVDISSEALALAKRNEALGHYCGTEMEYVEADVFEYLRKCRDAGRKFDVIVLDPPKFASSHRALERAARGYKDINLLAMKLLRANGCLATFSCSGAMSREFFFKVLSQAAADAGRGFQVVSTMRQAADHPVALSFPEGFYLKGALIRAI
ncbi:MAG: class I SAM-dependent rRNA methyltransferase [Kiritimatiellae bacterium]|nr:class I SAM-dependent rRNA methyltransferase [Kiritimatiellia bacterium]